MIHSPPLARAQKAETCCAQGAEGKSLEVLKNVARLHGQKIHKEQIEAAIKIRQAVNELKATVLAGISTSTEEEFDA